MKIISSERLDLLLQSKVNNKAIFLYLFLSHLSIEVDQDGHGYVFDFNINKAVRLLKAINIKTTHRQLNSSLKELENAGLIQYPIDINSLKHNKKILILSDLTLGAVEHNTVKGGYVLLSSLFYNAQFYNLSVREKRLLLYIYKNFIGRTHSLYKRDFKINILNKEIYQEICSILKIDRPQKIRNTLNHLKAYFVQSKLKAHRKNEVYSLKMTKEFIKSLEVETINDDIILEFNQTITDQIEIKAKEHQTTCPNISEVIRSTFFLSSKLLKKVLDGFYEQSSYKEIRNIQSYINKIIRNIEMEIPAMA